MRIALAVLVGVVLLAACASGYAAAGMDPSAPESVTVPIGAAGADAVRYVQQAATRGGFMVAMTSPGLVTVGPVSIPEDHTVRMMFAVSILADSASVRGTVTDKFRGLENYPIRGNTSGRAAWGWRELTRLADTLRVRR